MSRKQSSWSSVLTGALVLGSLFGSNAFAGKVRTNIEGHALNPVFSIDGQYVAFEVSNQTEGIDLVVAKLSGDIAQDGKRCSLPGASGFSERAPVAANPTWHPQGIMVFEGSAQAGSGQYRLFFSQSSGGAANFFVEKAELDGHMAFPMLNKDGSKMLFIAGGNGGDIYRMDTISRKFEKLTNTPGQAEMFPIFDSTGNKVLFTRKKSGTEAVFELDINTSAERVVASGSGDQTRPAYTSDNAAIYFDGGRGDGKWDIIVNDGSSKKTIARDVHLPKRARPALSPDHKWVAYTYEDPTKANSVFISRVDGSNTVEIRSAFTDLEEPAIAIQNGKTLLAFTALPGSDAGWRSLHVQDISGKL